METILDNNQGTVASPFKFILSEIWTSPRKVFQYVNETKYDKYQTRLFIIAGILGVFSYNFGLIKSIALMVIACLVGWVPFYISAFLISWTGKWLKGQANMDDILRIMAYAVIPSIISSFFFGISEILNVNPNSVGLVGTLLFLIFYLAILIFELWSLALYIIGIAEVQKFSIWKAIVNFVLPCIVIIAVVFVVSLIFGAMRLF